MPHKEPKVSIVLPTYNGSRYIQQSIESCLNQSYRNLELIVVVDGSTDDTMQKISSFKDPRLKSIVLEKNQGHIAALNKGFVASSGDLLTWTSDDNYYAPSALELMVRELQENPGIGFVYTQYQVVDDNNHLIKLGKSHGPDYLDVDNCVGGCFLYWRKVYETVGEFNPQAFLAEDYEYWLRVRKKFKMKRMDKVLYFYRLHEQSLTGQHREQKVLQQVAKVRDRLVPKYRRVLRRLRNWMKG